MQQVKQAVILAGGQGTRLRPLTNTIPKPLIPINGKPFVQYIIENLKKNNIKKIVLLVGYMGDAIEKYFKDGSEFGVTITYSYAPIEYDTGARLREATSLLDKYFLLLYCDNYWPLKIKELTKYYKKIGTEALVTVYTNKDNYSKNNIRVNEEGIVEAYDKSSKALELNGVDIGFFILKKDLFNKFPEDNFSFEKTILPQLISKKQLAGYMTNHKYYGLSNLNRIPQLKDFFKEKKVVLLDRDGVINKKPPKGNYVTNVDKFIYLSGAISGLKLLQAKKYNIFIVTNQAGVARGVMTEKELQKVHNKLLEVTEKYGVSIKDIYYCPHDWNAGCSCRKPQPGMLFRAAAEHNFDLTKAVFIGDDIRDKQAGEKAWCKTILMPENGSLLEVVKQL